MSDSKPTVIATLLLQKEIFGDDLFASVLETETIDYNDVPAGEMIAIHEPESVYAERSLEKGAFSSDALDLDSFNASICHCTICPLGATRKKFVFGVGDPHAKVMLVGEGPGADEDAQGEPFVGKAGQLLNDILKAIKFERNEVYIANIVKCRPPGNRKPEPEEVQKCLPYLHKQIELVKPDLILCLGATAAESLLNLQGTLKSMRLKEYKVMGITAMVTYHPAALLRNPAYKRDCWEDVKAFRKLYDNRNSD